MPTIFVVWHVGDHCTEDSIRSAFELYGRVDNVTLTCHCAIVQMPNDQEADEAARAVRESARYAPLGHA